MNDFLPLIKDAGGLGIAGAMIWVFVLMIKSINENNKSWREQVNRNTDKYDERTRETNVVLKELTEVIREGNHRERRYDRDRT